MHKQKKSEDPVTTLIMTSPRAEKILQQLNGKIEENQKLKNQLKEMIKIMAGLQEHVTLMSDIKKTKCIKQ